MKKSKTFNPSKSLTQNQFALLCGVNRSSITRAVENNLVTLDDTGKVLPSAAMNARYIRTHLLKAKRLIHLSAEEQEQDFAILNSLFTGEHVHMPAAPELYSADKIKVSDEDTIFIFQVGFIDEEGDFVPVVEVSRHPKKEKEICILPTEERVYLTIIKNELDSININDYRLEPLYMRMK